MKTLFFVCLALCIGLFSCKKDNTQAPVSKPSPLIGTWRVVSDSTEVTFIGGTHVTVYNGTNADFYQFNSDGTYVNQLQNTYGSGTYTFNDGELSLNPSNQEWAHARMTIQQLTDHSAVLISGVASPGGPSNDIITLAK